MKKFYVTVDYGQHPIEVVYAAHWAAEDGILRFYDGANKKICAYRKWIKVESE